MPQLWLARHTADRHIDCLGLVSSSFAGMEYMQLLHHQSIITFQWLHLKSYVMCMYSYTWVELQRSSAVASSWREGLISSLGVLVN
jgi:hypothetical protein